MSITVNVTNIFIPNGRVIRWARGGEHPVADGLIRLSGMTQAVFARTAERHGLPAAQARLLCMLAAGPRRMSELAGLLGIEKAALTGLADRAERRGLVARTAVPGDRRAVSVALTPEEARVDHDDHRVVARLAWHTRRRRSHRRQRRPVTAAGPARPRVAG